MGVFRGSLTYKSQALYFNPLFLLYGYDFYTITTSTGASIFLISKEKYKKNAIYKK